MKPFLFELKEQVTITCSGETGQVIARAEFIDSENQYQIRYKAADGRAVEAWWNELALQSPHPQINK